MSIIHFSARGTRRCVTPVTHEKSQQPHVPTLPGVGLLFTSADAEMRFFSLTPDSLPSADQLQRMPSPELAKMVEQAHPLIR